MLDVSIIIVNYNTKKLTCNCIDSIFNNTFKVGFEVIVVDNASVDGSIDVLAKDPRIIFIESGSNLGFGKANNLGLEKAKGKYVFFLNSDTVLLNDAISLFFEFFEKNEALKVGGVGTLLQNGDGERAHSYADLLTISAFLKKEILNHVYKLWGSFYEDYDNPKQIKENYFPVGYVTGADLFTSRNVLNSIGGAFDPDFFMYCEETEMQFRMKVMGYTNYILVGPKIVHLEQKSSTDTTSKPSIDKIIRMLTSNFLYFKKTNPRWKYKLFRMFFFCLRLHYLIKPSLSIKEKKRFFKFLSSEV